MLEIFNFSGGHTGKTYRLDRHFFPGANFGTFSLFIAPFGIKLVSDESSAYVESNELKFIDFKLTFIITKIAN